MMAAPADDPKVMVYYCFVSKNIIDFDEEPIKNVFKEALIAANVTSSQSSSDTQEQTQDSGENSEKWNSYEMPVLVNHSLDYVSRRLEEMDVECVIIGDGDEIIAQYPSSGGNDHLERADHLAQRCLDADHAGYERVDAQGCDRFLAADRHTDINQRQRQSDEPEHRGGTSDQRRERDQRKAGVNVVICGVICTKNAFKTNNLLLGKSKIYDMIIKQV